MGLEVTFYGPVSWRDEITEALHHANNTAKRTLRRDGQGRENAAWAAIHEYINFLLDLLEG